MRIPITVFAALVLIVGSVWPVAQRPGSPAPVVLEHGFHRHTEICRLIALPGDTFTFVPPPRPDEQPFYGPAAASFSVNYVGFSLAAQTAFQHAVDIWSGLITSPQVIYVNAQFTPLGANVLGQAGAVNVFRDAHPGMVPGTWYPDALADKIGNTDYSPPTYDIQASFNSTFANWYLGTNGATPGGQYDFVSVVLHELGHGLGFFGSATVSGGQGSWGLGGFPIIYDRFAFTEANAPIIGFTSPSAALGTQLQQAYNPGNPRGPGVYFLGPNANAANGGLSARLYTPATWAPGSSYSHLDENTYPPGNPNSLMTYALSAAEAIHTPGPVTLGMFVDMGWTAACAPSLNVSNATYPRSGGSGTVNVTIGTGCAWTATSNSGFLTITGGSSGNGNGTVSYNVAANAGSTNRVGTLTIAGLTFTVTQNGYTVTVSPVALNFAGTNNAGTLNPITPPQKVTVAFDAVGTSTWSASANQPWVQLTGANGTGAGSFTVGIINAGGILPPNLLSGQTVLNATITLTSTNVANSPKTIPVSLNLQTVASFAAPIGLVDTPLQNASGVVGAIAVTGWVVDDVGISSVQVYRNCLAFEPQGNCQVINGQNIVFIGNATLVPGARPDIEAIYPAYPASNVAAWGYLLLTNMLPHITNAQMFGGQGPLTLSMFAIDLDGHLKQLGRTQGDTTPTSIVMNNDNIAKPFGAIDTPGQGATVSGAAYANFGWSLTPDGDTVVGAGDIVVPTNGSTMSVLIDGAPVGTVSFNQCRGTVLGPVPGGVFCDDDVSNIFGNPTPLAPFTPRASNPTRHRNLDAGRGPIGAYILNTTTLTNGIHTIMWVVYDDAGRGEGIGSRFFTVLNGSSLTAGEQLSTAATLTVGSADALADAPVEAGTVWAQQGFTTPREEVWPDGTGRRAVRMPAQGRVELALGEGIRTGYLVANGTLRALPPGSRLDPATGLFTWHPVLGYLGTYELTFLRENGTQVPLSVTLEPDGTAAGNIQMAIDRPGAATAVSGNFTVEGWALDTGAWQGAGIGAVHVWAQRVDVPGAAPEFLGVGELNGVRTDVAMIHGKQFERAGWALSVSGLAPGTYDVTAYVWRTRTQRFEDARAVRIIVR